MRFLEDRVWPNLPPDASRTLTLEEEEQILGYGPDGAPQVVKPEAAAVVLDTSAIVAILTRESSAPLLLEKLLSMPIRLLPAPCSAEAMLVLRSKLEQDPPPVLNDFFREFDIQVIAFEAQHLAWFNYAFSTFGKGRHHAALNFGDCFTYSNAKSTGLPVLCTGNDFNQTDLVIA